MVRKQMYCTERSSFAVQMVYEAVLRHHGDSTPLIYSQRLMKLSTSSAPRKQNHPSLHLGRDTAFVLYSSFTHVFLLSSSVQTFKKLIIEKHGVTTSGSEKFRDSCRCFNHKTEEYLACFTHSIIHGHRVYLSLYPACEFRQPIVWSDLAVAIGNGSSGPD